MALVKRLLLNLKYFKFNQYIRKKKKLAISIYVYALCAVYIVNATCFAPRRYYLKLLLENICIFR